MRLFPLPSPVNNAGEERIMVIFKNLGVRAVVVLSCALMAVATLATAAIGYNAIRSLDERLIYATDNSVASLVELDKFKGAILSSRLDMAKHLLAQSPREMALRDGDLDTNIAGADQVIAGYKHLVADPTEQNLIDAVTANWDQWKATAATIRALPFEERGTTGAIIFNGNLGNFGKATTDALQAVIDYNQKLAVDDAVAAKATVRSVTSQLLAMGAGSAVIFLLAVLVLRNRLSAPLGALATAMEDMAGGNLDRDIPGATLTDEIGTIARALDAIKAGVSARSRDEAERQASIQAQVVEALAGSLGKLKAGRLDCRIDQAFPEEYEALRVDFNETVHTLSGVIVEVTSAADSVTTGSNEIASAANDLSMRTTSQAGAIEETAASVRQLNSSVAETAQLSDQVTRTAREAESVASESGAVMAEAVGAMEEISRSSSQMEAIVSLIDGIAFQTNLLALNAGVEAARAGEAGKGFAVVASEVRSLAQRASEAARDISVIIKSSGGNVTRGVALITRTQESLQQIHTRTTAVAEMIGTIASTAREQAAAIGQIDAAVAEMDGMTQKNAALVEESTAASRNLADEARRLDQLMSGFSTGTGTRRASHQPASRAPAPAYAPAPVAPPSPRRAVHGNAAVAEDWSSF
jgi:methyl-accepting chemotaxis protein